MIQADCLCTYIVILSNVGILNLTVLPRHNFGSLLLGVENYRNLCKLRVLRPFEPYFWIFGT
jgi:hypothetical protein